MKPYIIFLRAVNVSGKNIIKMSALQSALTEAGFKDVQTYIQSGNIVLYSNLTPAKLQVQIQETIRQHFHLDIDIFVLTPAALREALDQVPFEDTAAPNKVFITFLNAAPQQERLEALQKIDFGKEQFLVKKNILYFYLPEGMAVSKMNNNFFEQKLKVSATGRNLNTVRKVLAML